MAATARCTSFVCTSYDVVVFLLMAGSESAFLFGLFLVCCLLSVSCFGFCSRNVTRDLDYVSVLYQFTFAAITASAPARIN